MIWLIPSRKKAHTARNWFAVAGLVALGIALLALFSGCQIPRSQFDPRDEEENLKGPVFESMSLGRELPEEYLAPSEKPYRLGVGDVIEIEISEIKDTREETFIMPDGMVYFNLASGVPAKDRTIPELVEVLTEELEKDYAAPVVSISLKEVRSRRYWMLGRVFKPGIYPLDRPITLIQAISRAGGLFTSRFTGTTEELADLKGSFIIRDEKILPVDFDALIRDGDMSQNIYLQPDDYVYLPSSQARNVYVIGAVQTPQSVGVKDSLNVVKAVAACNGFLSSAYLTKCVLVRGSLQEPRVAVFNFKDILKGKALNFELQKGDILWIPNSPWDKLEKYLDTFLDSAARAIAVREGARSAGADDVGISVPIVTP